MPACAGLVGSKLVIEALQLAGQDIDDGLAQRHTRDWAKAKRPRRNAPCGARAITAFSKAASPSIALAGGGYGLSCDPKPH
jgi:hypothetical protein